MSVHMESNILNEDILDEFLDQRVYDITPGEMNVENDLLDDLYQHTYEGLESVDAPAPVSAPAPAQAQVTPENSGNGIGNAVGNVGNGGNNNGKLATYDVIRDELSRLNFGNANSNLCPKTVDVEDKTLLDFLPQAMAALPYELSISNLPSYSRVETQIKLRCSLSPPPPQLLLHIPQDLVSKNKFCLETSIDDISQQLKENMLYLDTYVLTSDLSKSCNICLRCIKREQKRASRRKRTLSGNESEAPVNPKESIKNNSASWADETMMKKAIIFNCKEIVSFPSPNGLSINSSKSLELSARIICYCRHHKEADGFKLLFVVRNHRGEVVAKELTSNIMIMDRKKTSKSKLVDTPMDLSKDTREASASMHPLSPNSIDESNSDLQTNTDSNTLYTQGQKRKKLSFDGSYNEQTNPMFNGSVIGFSPLSNSDTNTSASLHPSNQQYVLQNPQSCVLSPLTQHQVPQPQAKVPSIQRIIPAEGPVRGGVEVTLLGFNFRSGLVVKFGANQALATHCWSETTIVTYLPPASQPGQVLVSFENEERNIIGGPQQHQIFTYTDDTDRQLIELALQIVGLKMNGKLEDAKNIAKRIVGTDNGEGKGSEAANVDESRNSSTSGQMFDSEPEISISPSPTDMNEANIEWFDNAQKAVKQLTRSDLSTEEILINFLSLVDLPNCPIIIPNWQLCNYQGQTLLHLATLKNYGQLIKFLIAHGCKIDVRDNQGLTPLFFASLCGHRKLIEVFIDCKSSWNMKLSNDKTLRDYCDLNVLDIFSDLQEQDDSEESMDNAVSSDSKISKSVSLDSLNSMFAMSYGRHVSTMVMDRPAKSGKTKTQSIEKLININKSDSRSDYSEFADSECDSSDYTDDESSYISNERMEPFVADPITNLTQTPIPDDLQSNTSESTIVPQGEADNSSDDRLSLTLKPGLWNKVKTVFNNMDDESQLPSYDDLFPFGPSSFHLKPKSSAERQLNQINNGKVQVSTSSQAASEDGEDVSDSSEDMVVSYINHPRKTVENDKMLLFFWFPVLISLIGLVFLISVMGYKFEFIEVFKHYIRNSLGNLMVGNERIGRVFKPSNVASAAKSAVEIA